MNCVVVEAHERQLVESTGLELDPPMSVTKSVQLVDTNNATCITLTTSAMYTFTGDHWSPEPRQKCWFPGLSIKRRVPEAIKASFTVTITGRRLVCSTPHFEVMFRTTKLSKYELSGIYQTCKLSGTTSSGNEALITCAAKCECIGDECEHVFINIPELQESWELCEIGIK